MRNIGQAGKILADSGYQGLMKIYPQAIFAKVKTFKMISTTYRNHRKRFGLRMNLIAEKVSKTLDKTFDKDVREIPTSQFYQKFVDEMGRTYSGNLILQELITVNGAYKATYIGELSSN
ncbi:transposase-like protein%2C IS1381 ISSpn7 [Streptococcus pneumoniae]|nr:transposase-like protein%2C IS1381 ISSpn7 [Streptococcus pneumoniae]CMW73545.1 transposase-like protein%2C IS1381 ISSpn7 [Streptococcus pneumoniae]